MSEGKSKSDGKAKSVADALWVQRHINQGQPLKKNPSWSPSGDTRGLLKPLTSDLYVIKIDGY